jgi:hypothetical protein
VITVRVSSEEAIKKVTSLMSLKDLANKRTPTVHGPHSSKLSGEANYFGMVPQKIQKLVMFYEDHFRSEDGGPTPEL